MTSPVDDEKPEDDTEAEGAEKAPPAKTRKLVWVVWGFFILFSLYAFVGILMALFSTHVDPASLSVPSATVIEALPEPAAEVVPAENIPYPYEEDIQQEETQEESPVELDGATAPITPPIAPTEEPAAPPTSAPPAMVAPQSMMEPEKTTPLVTTASGEKPKIAIVIDDMGLNHPNSNRVVALPASLTLAYLPYAENLPKQTADAQGKGHELLVHMPMEPTDLAHNYPGPNALLTKNNEAENLKRLDKNLGAFQGYIGINNHMGSQFTRNADAIRPILAEIKIRGLWFLDSKTIGSSVAGDIAKQLGVPSVERDVFLDNVASVDAVNAQLRQLEAVARKKGYAVAIGHPHTATIEALKAWVTAAQARGFELVPLSEIIATRYPSAPIPKYARYQREQNIQPASGTETAATKIFQPVSLQQ